MSRYIDADALHDALRAKQKWVVRCGDKHNEGYTYDQVHFAIDEAPTIELIRCRECKHRYRSGYRGDEYWVCDFMDAKIKADDFCSYGERNSSEKPNNCETCKWWEEDTSFCYSKADSDDHACHYERSSE